MTNIDPLRGKTGADLTPKDSELLKAKKVETEFRQSVARGEVNGIHAVGSVVKIKGVYHLRVFGSTREGLASIGEDYKGLKFKKIKEEPPELVC